MRSYLSFLHLSSLYAEPLWRRTKQELKVISYNSVSTPIRSRVVSKVFERENAGVFIPSGVKGQKQTNKQVKRLNFL